MMTNQYVYQMFDSGDPTRFGAQVVSGVRFLGVGTINYILNNKAPKKSTISSFLQESRVLIDAFFQYIVSFGMKVNLIDGECVAVDGTIVKTNASNFRLIRIEEIEFLEGSYFNLMVQIWTKK